VKVMSASCTALRVTRSATQRRERARRGAEVVKLHVGLDLGQQLLAGMLLRHERERDSWLLIS
jgi:hypothetical protein